MPRFVFGDAAEHLRHRGVRAEVGRERRFDRRARFTDAPLFDGGQQDRFPVGVEQGPGE
jgi:hypothetical protein